jgi:transcriptional regulator with XRE-family HTH domain
MAISLNNMMKDLSPERRAKVEHEAEVIIERSRTISQLRKDLGLTQAQVADALDTTQGNLAQIEAKHDVLVSTVARVVEALGGKLRLKASIPGRGEFELQLGQGKAAPPEKMSLRRQKSTAASAINVIQNRQGWMVKRGARETIGPFANRAAAIRAAKTLAQMTAQGAKLPGVVVRDEPKAATRQSSGKRKAHAA